MTDRLTDSQRIAIETLDGPLFVAAGAGSGKTRVVTRRFVHAIATGAASVDQILTITFTKKAAAEMMSRIRDLLRQRWTLNGSPDQDQLTRMAAAYRQIERAQISTIDSFCAAMLRANALAAGIDPGFTAVDESQAQVIREEVFDVCLTEFVNRHGAAATGLISAYDPNLEGTLFNAIAGIYDRLRSQGRPPALPQPASRLPEAEAELQTAIATAAAAAAALAKPSATIQENQERLIKLAQALAETDDLARLRLAGEAMPGGQLGQVKEEFEAVKGAVEFFLTEIRSVHARPTLELFGDLLESFARHYETEKHSRGVLDFGDLSVGVRDLLKNNPDIRRNVASRYRLVMVDEFQDTNELQLEIISHITDNNLFLVGDENQSIYGFRDAVVELFQERKQTAAAKRFLVELDENFRSQPQILAMVDHIFDREGMLRPGYLRLTAAADPDGHDSDRRVEVILIDERRKSTKENLQLVPAEITRKAEARLIAMRLKELAAEGFEIGDMAVLVRKAKQADLYRQALKSAGLPSYLSVGKSYFEKLELGDVINMFRLVINPLDDLAMFAALRSPMAGISDDSLYWVRQSARDANGSALPVWSTLGTGTGSIEGLAPSEREKLTGFIGGLQRLREFAARAPLAAIAGCVIDFNDYGATAAASRDGKQKLANLSKLLEMAADFDAAWGSNLTDFTEFLERQKNVKAREAEAPTEEEGVQAVRFLTMHGAKGLEFPLVVLPDLGARGFHNDDLLLIDRRGTRVGLIYKSSDGFAGKTFDFEPLKREQQERELKEEKRLGYVAMTRARSHLILSGIAAADRLPNDKASDPPFDWLRRHLQLCWDRDESLGQVECLEDINGTAVGVSICTDPETKAALYESGEIEPSAPKPLTLQPDITKIPPPAVYVPPTLSPTAIDTFVACPRRYYLDRVLGAREIMGGLGEANAGAATRSPGLSPQDLGTLVHALLERAEPPLHDPVPLTHEQVAATAASVLPAGTVLTTADAEKAAALVSNLSRAAIAAELNLAATSNRLKRELSFSTMAGPTILRGQMDAFVERDEGSLVVDYKTGARGTEHTTAEAAAGYENQMAAYALAASRLKTGPVEVVLLFLDDPVEEISRVFTQAQIRDIEADLLEKLQGMGSGDFPPLADFDARVCSQCAGNRFSLPLCSTAARQT